MKFLFLLIFVLFPVHAKADYFVWADPESGLSLSFPDTWKRVQSKDPDDVLILMAPSENAKPQCRIRTREDKRYLIYPPELSDSIQRIAVSKPFWDDYFGEFDESIIYKIQDGAGLGRGFASFALARYTERFGTRFQERDGILFASLYNDTMYIVECSALTGGYDNYRFIFQSVIKSIDFKKAHHELATGNYADFLAEGAELAIGPERLKTRMKY